jgi:hypothetical protein
MASNSDSRGGLLSAGGVLSVIAGISQIISGLLLASIIFFPNFFVYLGHLGLRMLFLPFLPDAWWEYFVYELGIGPEPVLFVMCAGALGIVAIVGGISAIRRKRFGLSLAGAIFALPSVILGILAVIFVSLGKREFGTGRK